MVTAIAAGLVLLAVTVTIVMLASSMLTAAFGRAGLILGTATAGLADSQSAAISAATLSSSRHISTTGASVAILAALTSNTFSKAAVAAALGKRRYAANVWPGLALILAGAWAAGSSPAWLEPAARAHCGRSISARTARSA